MNIERATLLLLAAHIGWTGFTLLDVGWRAASPWAATTIWMLAAMVGLRNTLRLKSKIAMMDALAGDAPFTITNTSNESIMWYPGQKALLRPSTAYHWTISA